MKSRTSHAHAHALDLEPVPSTRMPASGVIPKSREATDAAIARVHALVEAAGRCFAARGIGATTLADIAHGLGLRKSIVHYYFASKDQLLLSVQSHAAEKYLDAVRTSGKTAGPTVKDLLTVLWDSLRAQPSLAELNVELIAEARRRPDLKKLVSSVEGQIRDELRTALEVRSVRKDQSECLAGLILSTFRGLSLATTLEGGAQNEQKAYECFTRLAQLASTLEAVGQTSAAS